MGLRKRLLGEASEAEIERLVKQGATIVDIRTQAEFEEGHVPGAMHIPLNDLERKLPLIPRDRPIVTCNADDAMSAIAAEILSAHGLKAVDGGGWRSLMAKLHPEVPEPSDRPDPISHVHRILIPTDLSARAFDAAVMTIDLFGAFGVRYTLVHAYPLAGFTDPVLPSVATEVVRSAVDALDGFEKKLRAHFHAARLDLNSVAGPGPLSCVVEQETLEARADLVVMYSGKHGTPALFGSNTTDVMRLTNVPVLELPFNTRELTIKRILFADDRSVINSRTLKALVFIAGRTNAEVLIAHIATGRPAKKQVDHAQLFRKVFEHVRTRTLMIEDDDVPSALLDVASREKVDLIAVLHRHKRSMKELLHCSVTRKVGLNTRIPVLALEQ